MKIIFLLMTLIPIFAAAQFSADSTYLHHGIIDKLPVFTPQQVCRLAFPYSWLSGNFKNFAEWKTKAREKYRECMLAAPPAVSFNPTILAEQDRGKYIARKISLNISADSRVCCYMLIPKGKGPFPAVLLLHDHGGRFDIGKEKVIEPFDEPAARIDSARMWIQKLYGGRFIGDELADRGYVCFATDALNWGDRGGGGGEQQQAIASNLMNIGMSLAGVIAWDDLRSADFLASQPEVDNKRIAAVGFSFGSYRSWQLAALSDHISCGIAVCWMGTIKGLMSPSNNLTKGQSAFTTTHPGLSNYLDIPDMASIACPKPMLFFNGEQDKLFPPDVVTDAYRKMESIWESQNAGRNLTTKLWNVGHVFNREMQEEAFRWLDLQCKK